MHMLKSRSNSDIAPAPTHACAETCRLDLLGVEALLDHELLAVAVGRAGTRAASAVQLARAAALLDSLGGAVGLIRYLDSIPAGAAATLPGGLLTANRQRQLSASLALFRRGSRGPSAGLEIERPADVAPWIRAQLGGLGHEVFGAAFISSRGRLLKIEVLFKGGLNQTTVYPREIARRALLLNASRLVLFHNHPSGSTEPSHADLRLTRQLSGLLQGLEISIWDHLLLAGEQVISIGNGSC